MNPFNNLHIRKSLKRLPPIQKPIVRQRSISEHDVFISFRGKDTRRNFVSYLHASLANLGIKVFIDDKGLQRGQGISPSLHQAIDGSNVALVVFSTNYADSLWCLEELEEIMICHVLNDMEVLTIFFNVDPLEVRSQKGTFGEVFENLIQKKCMEVDEIIKWRKTLTEAANLSGYHWKYYSYSRFA